MWGRSAHEIVAALVYLIYNDPRIPSLAPAYDLVSTRFYMGGDELGLKFGGKRSFERFRLFTFDLLERRLGVKAGLGDVARETVAHVVDQWAAVSGELRGNPDLRSDVGRSIEERSETVLMGSRA